MANEKQLDLINRNELIAACRKTLMTDVFPNWRNMPDNEKNIAGKICDTFKKIIINAPAVNAVPVEFGGWQWFEEWNPSTTDNPRECDDCGWQCSKCKTALADMVGGYWDDYFEKPKLNYCPNCGVQMYKERND